ncbi:MAG TPA: MOSC N-terminal beta barrel domain-containing protein [Rubrobacteraceae bacterium]|nr:MOSC N-terminal beta barrel domain-containing protein [Rubrobacteraceae bacterium]
MATSGIVGAVAGLWRFPVKSMRGERLEQAQLTESGLVGDRAYALIDTDTGKVVSAKSVRLFPGLLGCRAAFVEPPRAGGELPPVLITLPDGTSVTSDSSDVDRVLSAYFRRDVTLARAAPDEFTIDQYHPDIEDVDPAGYRDTVVEQKLGSAFFAQGGLASPLPAGSFLDLFPVSVLTTSTIEQLSELQPQSRFDERRFRMNVIVGAEEGGFVENDWIGHELSIGDEVRLGVALPDPRCVMTTLAQEELPKDTDVLRTLTQHNRVQVGAAGLFPCAGVYAVVEASGTVRVGDRMALPSGGVNSAQAPGPVREHPPS